jgi:pilus assembly protein CpaE
MQTKAVGNMMIALACDCPNKSARMRQALERAGYNCPLGNVVGVESVGRALHPPDLALVVLPADYEQAQAAVKRVREAIDLPIVAVGPRDPNLILCALRSGANDFVDESGDLHSELSAAVSRLSTHTHGGRTAQGRLITIVGSGGGSGRTLLATNLAVALAKTQNRSVLFDFDFAAGDVATVLDLKPRHTVADLCRNFDKLDQKMFEQSLLEHESGVSVLAAPESWDSVGHVTGEGLEKIVRFGRMLFANVVVDLDAFWLGEFTHLLQQSSSIFLLCRMDLSTIRNARRALDYFDHIHLDRDNVHLIAARNGRAKEIATSQAELVLEREIEYSTPEDSSTANLSINCGVPLILESPSCSLAKAISTIAKSATRDRKVAATEAAQAQNGHAALPVLGKVRALLGMAERGFLPRTDLLTGS